MTITIQVGDRVAYSRDWLRSVGAMTGELPFRRGWVRDVIVCMGGTVIANVEWTDGGMAMINVANLVRGDRLHLERT